ncbi:MAG: hypothetical protein J5720_01940 [Bacteroidaceae bacterium]|nr:hypothetical protein [Bacteroidaceae bacterium]
MNYFLLATIAVMCAMTISTVLISCTRKNNHSVSGNNSNADLVISFDSIEIEPYMQFGASLAEVGKYMTDNYEDYSVENPGSLLFVDGEDGDVWFRCYVKGDRRIGFYFADKEGKNLKLVSYDFFFPMELEPVVAELERNGYVYKGEVKFDDYNADVCHLYLSADESVEVQLSSWEKDGGSWAISFQPTCQNDLEHIVAK